MNLSQTQEFVVKVAGGAVAIVLFVLSSLANPVLVIDPTLRIALLIGGLAAFGLAVKQGVSAVQVSQAVSDQYEFEQNA